MIDISRIVSVIANAAIVTPEFIDLAEEVARVFKGKDQADLKTAITQARRRSDALHADIARDARD